MTDPSSSVRIEGISKSFGQSEVLKSLNLDIASGEFFSLLGPSGCGKSTLLNILGGLTAPDRGRILIGSEDVTGLPPEHRPTNMVFQSYAVFPHLNVARNIAYGLRRKRLGRAELDRRVGRMLELVHLDGMAERNPAELSGGQQQRVALARALVMEPRVLLLDESLAALDKRLRQSMQVELRELQRKVGITFVFVTHDQDEAMAMSDRIAVMGAGEILQVDSPTRLYHEPICREVAEFIGSINFFPIAGTTRHPDGEMLDGGPLGAFRIADDVPSADSASRCFLAVRPEAICVKMDGAEGEPNTLLGTVLETVFLGDRSFIRARVEHQTEPVLAACPYAAAHGLSIGQNVWLRWEDDAGRIIANRQ